MSDGSKITLHNIMLHVLRKKHRLPNNNKYDNEGGNTINLLNHKTRPKITELMIIIKLMFVNMMICFILLLTLSRVVCTVPLFGFVVLPSSHNSITALTIVITNDTETHKTCNEV